MMQCAAWWLHSLSIVVLCRQISPSTAAEIQELIPVANFSFFSNTEPDTWSEDGRRGLLEGTVPPYRTRGLREQPLPDTMNLAFSIRDEHFDFQMEIFHELVADGRTLVTDASGTHERLQHRLTTYHRRLTNGYIVCTVLRSGSVHVVLRRLHEVGEVDEFGVQRFREEILQVDHHDKLRDRVNPTHYSQVRRIIEPHGHVAFIHDGKTDQGAHCGHATDPSRKSNQHGRHVAATNEHLRRMLTRASAASDDGGRNPTTWTDCFIGDNLAKNFAVGFAADADFCDYATCGTHGTGCCDPAVAEETIRTIVADVNTVYAFQLNIYITVGQMYIKTTRDGDNNDWSDQQYPSCFSIDSLLTLFRQWETNRGTLPERSSQGTWHMLGRCHGDCGTVGLAYQGVLCQGGGSNSGVSGFGPCSTWKTIAHELGHNFGAGHPFIDDTDPREYTCPTRGGIMDYDDGRLDLTYQFNSACRKAEMCTEINAKIGCSAFSPHGPAVCGDGVLDIPKGEQCECATGVLSCQCCSNCQLTEGAQCASGECCDISQCKLASVSTPCDGGTKHCMNGVCTTSLCERYNSGNANTPWTYCGPAVDSTCQLKCNVEGTCSSLVGWTDTNTGRPLSWVEDNAICTTSAGNWNGLCSSGACVYAGPATCGDGELDTGAGEECECPNGSTSCSCCENCRTISCTAQYFCTGRLPVGATCYTGECCDLSVCQYASVATTCDGGSKHCINGNCVASNCDRYGLLPYCGAHSNNDCKIRCTRQGQCSTLDGVVDSNTRNPINHAPDGAACTRDGLRGTCSNGVCNALPVRTSSPTQRSTGSPTQLPTMMPTSFPTMMPTSFPTASPSSMSPSTRPSSYPTEVPSMNPTVTTEAPSSEPTTSAPTLQECMNNQMDPGETDVDCGGSSCSGCILNQRCTIWSDCLSRTCRDGRCVRSTSSPTLVPTTFPTKDPTTFPTEDPTTFPTMDPTASPSSRSPTNFPTVAPSSTSPSRAPVSSPTWPEQSPVSFICSEWSTCTGPQCEPCSATCVFGVQMRSCRCIDRNGQEQAEVQCFAAGLTKPNTQQQCYVGPCTRFEWQLEVTGLEYAACDANCDSGEQERISSGCVSTTITDQGSTIAEESFTSCLNAGLDSSMSPPAQKACKIRDCVVEYTVGQWGECSRSCGGGTRSRSVTCQAIKNGGRADVSLSRCESDGLQTPASLEPCNEEACDQYFWDYSNWEQCLDPVTGLECGASSGTQRRGVGCIGPGDTVSNNDNCNVEDQLPTSRSCILPPCVEQHSWISGVWEACNVVENAPSTQAPECGEGVRRREVRCIDSLTMTTVNDITLCTKAKPHDIERCYVPQENCRVLSYVQTPWGICGENGHTCLDNDEWRDREGYACSDYEINNWCEEYGSDLGTLGLTANNACCACGGGTSSVCGISSHERCVMCIDVSFAEKFREIATAGSAGCETISASLVGHTYELAECTMHLGYAPPVSKRPCRHYNNESCGGEDGGEDQCANSKADFFWRANEWAVCDRSCGGGQRTRVVECIRDYGNRSAVVDSSLCRHAPPPSSHADCNKFACPTYVASNWGECSELCGEGTRARSVLCFDGFGRQVVDADCASFALPKPPSVAPCVGKDGPCPHWHKSSWSKCNRICGGGNRTRDITCRLPHDDIFLGIRVPLDDVEFRCINKRPESTEICSTDSCTNYYWAFGAWSACSRPCSPGGLQSRAVVCMSTIGTEDLSDDVVAADQSRCLGTKPLNSKACNELISCPDYSWAIMPIGGDNVTDVIYGESQLTQDAGWSTCSKICGGGTQNRVVQCHDRNGEDAVVGYEIPYLVVDENYCDTATKPSPIRTCNTDPDICNVPGDPTLIVGRCASDGKSCQCAPGRSTISGGGVSVVQCNVMASIHTVRLYTRQSVPTFPGGDVVEVHWQHTGQIEAVDVYLFPPAIGSISPLPLPWPLSPSSRLSNVNAYHFTIPTEAPAGEGYRVGIFAEGSVFNFSEGSFAIADPCCFKSCGTHGSCTNEHGMLGGGGKCVCETNYTGARCTDSRCDRCIESSTESCEEGHCSCKLGWSGKRCEVRAGCTNPCQNGGIPNYASFITTADEQEEVGQSCTSQSCICDRASGYGGAQCATCSLSTLPPHLGGCYRGISNERCTACICGKGYFSRLCDAHYIDGTIFVELGPSHTYQDSKAFQSSFVALLQHDVAKALRSANRSFADVKVGDSVEITHQDGNLLNVSFRLLQHDFSISAGVRDQYLRPWTGIRGIHTPVHSIHLRHLVSEESDEMTPEAVVLVDATNELIRQSRDPWSVLRSRGYLTSKIVPSKGFQISDASGELRGLLNDTDGKNESEKTQPETDGDSRDQDATKHDLVKWAVIGGAVVGGLLVVSLLFVVVQRAVKRSRNGATRKEKNHISLTQLEKQDLYPGGQPRPRFGTSEWNISAPSPMFNKSRPEKQKHTFELVGRPVSKRRLASPTNVRAPTSSLPKDWERHVADNGDPYFFNIRSGETTWDHPSAEVLPEGWTRYEDEEGQPYYHNDGTQVTQRERPRSARVDVPPVPKRYSAKYRPGSLRLR